MPIQSPAPQSKKLQQFLEELNDLSERYQYSLDPYLVFDRKGVIPR